MCEWARAHHREPSGWAVIPSSSPRLSLVSLKPQVRYLLTLTRGPGHEWPWSPSPAPRPHALPAGKPPLVWSPASSPRHQTQVRVELGREAHARLALLSMNSATTAACLPHHLLAQKPTALESSSQGNVMQKRKHRSTLLQVLGAPGAHASGTC